MNMQQVNSTNLDSIGYDADTMKLYVLLKDGNYYIYEKVPNTIYDDLLSADSKGSYLNRKVKGIYNYNKQMTLGLATTILNGIIEYEATGNEALRVRKL